MKNYILHLTLSLLGYLKTRYAMRMLCNMATVQYECCLIWLSCNKTTVQYGTHVIEQLCNMAAMTAVQYGRCLLWRPCNMATM